MALTGGCQCGAVRYRLDGEPGGSNVCHCRMCQKASGAPFMAFTGVKLAELVWTQGAPGFFASSNVAERGFCPTCGTPLTYRFSGADRICVTIGSLDHPDNVAPRTRYGLESKVSWVDSVAALPAGNFSAALQGLEVVSHQHPDHDA